MEQDQKRVNLIAEVEPDIKRWLESKAAERMVEGRPHGERSVGAVIRDILASEKEREAMAMAS